MSGKTPLILLAAGCFHVVVFLPSSRLAAQARNVINVDVFALELEGAGPEGGVYLFAIGNEFTSSTHYLVKGPEKIYGISSGEIYSTLKGWMEHPDFPENDYWTFYRDRVSRNLGLHEDAADHDREILLLLPEFAESSAGLEFSGQTVVIRTRLHQGPMMSKDAEYAIEAKLQSIKDAIALETEGSLEWSIRILFLELTKNDLGWISGALFLALGLFIIGRKWFRAGWRQVRVWVWLRWALQSGITQNRLARGYADQIERIYETLFGRGQLPDKYLGEDHAYFDKAHDKLKHWLEKSPDLIEDYEYYEVPKSKSVTSVAATIKNRIMNLNTAIMRLNELAGPAQQRPGEAGSADGTTPPAETVDLRRDVPEAWGGKGDMVDPLNVSTRIDQYIGELREKIVSARESLLQTRSALDRMTRKLEQEQEELRKEKARREAVQQLTRLLTEIRWPAGAFLNIARGDEDFVEGDIGSRLESWRAFKEAIFDLSLVDGFEQLIQELRQAEITVFIPEQDGLDKRGGEFVKMCRDFFPGRHLAESAGELLKALMRGVLRLAVRPGIETLGEGDFREELRKELIRQVVSWRSVLTPILRGEQFLTRYVQPLLAIDEEYGDRPELRAGFRAFLCQVKSASESLRYVLDMADLAPDPLLGLLNPRPELAERGTERGGRSEWFSVLRKAFQDAPVAEVMIAAGVKPDDMDCVIDVSQWGLCRVDRRPGRQRYIIIPDCRSRVMLLGDNLVNLDRTGGNPNNAEILDRVFSSIIDLTPPSVEVLEPGEFEGTERAAPGRPPAVPDEATKVERPQREGKPQPYIPHGTGMGGVRSSEEAEPETDFEDFGERIPQAAPPWDWVKEGAAPESEPRPETSDSPWNGDTVGERERPETVEREPSEQQVQEEATERPVTRTGGGVTRGEKQPKDAGTDAERPMVHGVEESDTAGEQVNAESDTDEPRPGPGWRETAPAEPHRPEWEDRLETDRKESGHAEHEVESDQGGAEGTEEDRLRHGDEEEGKRDKRKAGDEPGEDF
jgi:hypothetical protein